MVKKQKMVIKNAKTKLIKNVSAVLPLVEEITKIGMIPFCLIAVKANVKKDKIVYTHWATISNDMDEMLMELCKQMAEKGKIIKDDKEKPLVNG